MANKENCTLCKYSQIREVEDNRFENNLLIFYECKRHAPTSSGCSRYRHPWIKFPENQQWCGEFVKKTEKEEN